MRTGFVRTFIWEQPQNPVVWDLILFQWQSGGLACLKTDRHENCVRWSVTGCGFSIRFDNFSPEILGWAASVWWRFEILGQRSERIAGNKLTSSVSIGQSFATVGVSTLDQAPNFLWMALSLSRLPPNIPWLITPPKWRFWGFSQRISTSLSFYDGFLQISPISGAVVRGRFNPPCWKSCFYSILAKYIYIYI